jgi:predicted site-specific integrase-resolvase
MILSMSDAARKVGVSRATLYKMRAKGQISTVKNAQGKTGIDASELYRVFPKETDQPFHIIQRETTKSTISEIIEAHLQEKIRFLENQLILEQDRVTTLLEINKNNSEKGLLTHQEQPQKTFWKRLFG